MRRAMSNFGIFFLINFITISAVSAANYYVRTDGNDSNCNGLSNISSTAAPNCAFSTVSKAASIVSAGDVVIIQPGTYSETVTFSKAGSPASPITFKGSGAPVIKGNVFFNGSYNILDGVTVSPPTAGGYSAILMPFTFSSERWMRKDRPFSISS